LIKTLKFREPRIREHQMPSFYQKETAHARTTNSTPLRNP
jgi:hypothetical protein